MAEIRGINRTNDYAFKRIFGTEEGKEVLIGFLNAVMKPLPGRELVDLELLDREIDPVHVLERGARLDLLARTGQGALINVEVQVANQYNIDKRTMYYWAALYHGQLTGGEAFGKLCKAVTINILGFKWFRKDVRYHHCFHIRDDETGEPFSDDLEMHFLELEKIKQLRRKPVDDLEGWLMYLSNLEGEEMEAIAVDNPGIRKALTIERAFWQSKKERRIYEMIEKAKRDEISALLGARAEGRAEGKAEGKAEGRAQMAQEAICKYLKARFGINSLEFQRQVMSIDDLEILDRIINKIYTADSLEEAQKIIEGGAM